MCVLGEGMGDRFQGHSEHRYNRSPFLPHGSFSMIPVPVKFTDAKDREPKRGCMQTGESMVQHQG